MQDLIKETEVDSQVWIVSGVSHGRNLIRRRIRCALREESMPQFLGENLTPVTPQNNHLCTRLNEYDIATATSFRSGVRRRLSNLGFAIIIRTLPKTQLLNSLHAAEAFIRHGVMETEGLFNVDLIIH